VVAFGLGWPLLTVYTVTPLAHTTVGVLFTYVALLGSALLVTWWADGVAGVRALLRRLLVWRFSAARWLVVLLSMPALTVAAAGLSGTLRTPDGGWAAAGTAYLFATVVPRVDGQRLQPDFRGSAAHRCRLGDRFGRRRRFTVRGRHLVAAPANREPPEQPRVDIRPGPCISAATELQGRVPSVVPYTRRGLATAAPDVRGDRGCATT
jgi:hypothetical protein